jgi:hypothetical protein
LLVEQLRDQPKRFAVETFIGVPTAAVLIESSAEIGPGPAVEFDRGRAITGAERAPDLMPAEDLAGSTGTLERRYHRFPRAISPGCRAMSIPSGLAG